MNAKRFFNKTHELNGFDWKKNWHKNTVLMSFSVQPSSVTIFFRDHQVVTLKRSELYTYTDFLAICGGLFLFRFIVLAMYPETT